MTYYKWCGRLLIVIAVLAINFLSMAVSAPAELTIYAEDRVYRFSNAEIGWIDGRRTLKGCESVVERIVADTFVAPVDASLSFNKNQAAPFVIHKEKDGKIIDKWALSHKIEHILQNGGREIRIKASPVKAKITTDELQKYTHLRGEFATDCSTSTINRIENIRLACEAINGTVVDDCEEFSFNKAVGERTAERGYKSAKIIFDGQFVDGIGGGICQVSSTLFNCALISDLTVTERHSHSIAVGYVEPSFDAMVSSHCDLKFTNNTQGPLFIRAIILDGKIIIEIYGTKNPYTITRESEIIEKTELIYKGENGEDAREGDEIIVPAHPKIKSRGMLLYSINGNTVFTRSLGISNYAEVIGVKAGGKS